MLYAATAAAASFLMSRRMRRRRKDPRGRRLGSKVRCRVRRSVESVHQEIGEVLFRRAYRMTYESFRELQRLLENELLQIHKQYQDELTAKRKAKRLSPGKTQNKRWKRFVPNGNISSTVHLAIALRFFCRGKYARYCSTLWCWEN